MNSLLVISSYPTKQSIHGKATVGIASYAKNTLLSIKKIAPRTTDITVLAEKLVDDKDHFHNGIEVKRVWKRGSFLAMPTLLKEILLNNRRVRKIVIELELSMFGEIFHLLPFPLFLLILKIAGKQVFVVNHQVIPNLKEIGPHININDHTFLSILYDLGLRFFYFFIILFSSKVIVFEDILKNRLSSFGNTRKIKVISHGVEEFKNSFSRTDARKKLGLSRSDFVAISFGYLAWYKGSDWLVSAIGEVNKTIRGKKIKLILAGGPNPNRSDKAFYAKYISTLEREAAANGATITGFINQKDIPLYYKAADVIILPYRTFMSASGPLSIAFSFKKPFLISSPLKGVLDQDDIDRELNSLRISNNSVVFGLTKEALRKSINNLRKSKKLQKKLSSLSSNLSKKRSWDIVGKNYYEELFN